VPRWRLLVAGGIVAGLASVLVYFLFVDSNPVVVAATTPTTASTTTTSTPSTSASAVTTTEATTTTSAEDRVEEVRAIVQELWFGWFDAIYRQDAEALWNVVATEEGYTDGIASFSAMDFVAPPTRTSIRILELELLLDRTDCVVVYTRTDLSAFRGPKAISASIVSVLWPTGADSWRFASQWKNKIDLWANDCDLREREALP